jgi:hypothetical protein
LAISIRSAIAPLVLPRLPLRRRPVSRRGRAGVLGFLRGSERLLALRQDRVQLRRRGGGRALAGAQFLLAGLKAFARGGVRGFGLGRPPRLDHRHRGRGEADDAGDPDDRDRRPG